MTNKPMRKGSVSDFSVFTEPLPSLAQERQSLIDVLSRTCQGRHNAIATVHREAVQALARLHVPHIPLSPSPDHFRDVADFLLHWARIADRVLKIVGEEANSNTSEVLSVAVFKDQFVSALEADAIFELERCAQAVEAEQEYGDYYEDDEYEDRAATD
jgi:hypothetical protein